MLSRNGILAIATEVAPREALCDEARGSIDRFVEVRVASAGESDPSGIEEAGRSAAEPAARSGAAAGAPRPLVSADPAAEEESAGRVLATLEALGYLPRVGGVEYSADEEEEIKSRLRDLGYI
jgi:hypothetical protein